MFLGYKYILPDVRNNLIEKYLLHTYSIHFSMTRLQDLKLTRMASSR